MSSTPRPPTIADPDSADATHSPSSTDARLATESDRLAGSLGEYVAAWVKRIKNGESGVLPVLAGLVILIIIFQLKSSVFLSSGNIVNLLTQGATFVLLGMAEVFVLLLGEIDLSIGFVAANGAVITVALSTSPHNLSWPISILAGLLATAAIGAVQGLLITLLRLPSFVVTLAGLLGFQGTLLWLVSYFGGPSSGGTISITNNVILDLVTGYMGVTTGWIVLAVTVVTIAATMLWRDSRRRRAGLAGPPFGLVIAKIAVITVAGVVLVAICNANRGVGLITLQGVPWVIPIVLVILAAWTFLLSKTKFGRYMYAIGGNAEAARRAGIQVNLIRVAAFILAGLTAGAGGIIYASRLGSISNNVDGGQLVLYAVAAAVIGGTSLFGGRGKMLHALLGGLVIATIYNGTLLIGLSSATQYMVTALVLLGAVTVDAVARRGRTT